MPRNFDVPEFYRSNNFASIKRLRQLDDPKKRDLSPTILDFGPVVFKIARHFGFCYGVENAIEIAYRAIRENPERRVFLLSEMIHNPGVNKDLSERGVRFLMDTNGKPLIPFSSLNAKDIVIVPAFGTTVELQHELSSIGIDPYYYDTTCPFVEKVWRRSGELGKQGFSVIVHGKKTHEETRATFSHSKETSPTLIVLDMKDAEYVVDFMYGKISIDCFNNRFHDCMSNNFDPTKHLEKIGVVNQTTMLATETQAIAAKFKQAMCKLYGGQNLHLHFADTRDTLCYATHENQSATRKLIESGADIAIVVGGYNSSNTSHLVELCEEAMKTYYIRDHTEIIDKFSIRHFILSENDTNISNNWLPINKNEGQTVIALTSGASCPDSTVDEVLKRIVSFYENTTSFDNAFSQIRSNSL
jgi:4-hydroxy-3-methylbut-2-en-1-yl diphosphate reductase